MSDVFLDYSKYYDLLYKDKDYKSEVDFIVGLIRKYHPTAKTILNLGCGTGQHDLFLANLGYEVTGVDFSKEMLTIAEKKNPTCDYFFGDARYFKVDKKFDVIISLFHVLSYQTTNNEVQSFLNTIYQQLEDDGVAIFDYWYGPAVLNLRPEKRTKNFESNELSISRHALTDMDYVANVATVNFNINVHDKLSDTFIEMNEKHPMRYFFSPELELFFMQNKFKQLAHHQWLKTLAPPSEDSWSAYSVIGKDLNT